MPMPAKGPHLALRRRQGRPAIYVIRDTGKVEQSTGTGDRGEAEKALAAYINGKASRVSPDAPASPSDLTIADALAVYLTEHGATVAAPERLSYAAKALIPFWGELPVAAIKKETCRRYARVRGKSNGTIRRELNVLQAAINYCVEEGKLLAGAKVELPDKPPKKQRALTRSEVARLLWACRKRETTRHLARFILVSLYTGTRKAAVLNLRLDMPSAASGWVDLKRGVMHRRGSEERETAKRRTSVRLPRQLLAHMRRWHRNGAQWAVEWRGNRIADVQTGFEAVQEDAALGWRPTPHTLKHTAISWAIQAGSSVEDAATFFGTSPQTIIDTYWDQSPHFQQGAVEAVERMGRRK